MAANTVSTEAAQAVFKEIAALAAELELAFSFLPDSPDDELQSGLNSIRRGVQQIGWMADFGTGGRFRGDAQEWLLPPAARQEVANHA